ncbi:MAG: aminomethyl transferase family protein [Thermodesulfobacteriota bacterium]
MTNSLKTTPLYKWHKEANANMADFGGFNMPLWYETGVKNEHLGVLKSAGIFDTSHMVCINVKGKDSFELLNYCFTRDLESLVTGRCIYGAFLDINGYCIDDAIIYKFSESFFMICVNAGMGETIARHLLENQKNLDVEIEDLSGKFAKLDIQGINSARILSSLIKNPDMIFNKMPYFSFKGNFNESIFGDSLVQLLDNTPILLSRSGYTGEFGFEIFINPNSIVKLWEDILTAGKDFGITACGLGARDSLRAGACLPLSHQDIGKWKFINHPWEFALAFNKDKTSFTKDFLGSHALLPNNCDSFIYPFVGDSLRKILPGKDTQVIDKTDKIIGKVLTCVTDMGISWKNGDIISINSQNIPEDFKIKGLSCGFVMVSKELDESSIKKASDTRLTLKEGKRSIKVTIVKDIRPDRTARKKLANFIN